MRAVNNRGFTLVELSAALALFGVVSAVAFRAMLVGQQAVERHFAMADLSASTRTAMVIIPDELRGLNATDPLGGDIASAGPSSITYKALRSLYFVCRPPAAGSAEVVVAARNWGGLRALDSQVDSVFIFADGDPRTPEDDSWIRASVTGVAPGAGCPGGNASLTVSLSGVSEPGVGAVRAGAPVRGVEVHRLLLYRDRYGDFWMGASRYRKSGSGWTRTQPVLGPLTETGLRFEYRDNSGALASNPSLVSRIDIKVVARSPRKLHLASGEVGFSVDSLSTSVVLRNNTHF